MTNKFVSRAATIAFAIIIGIFGVSHFIERDYLISQVPIFIPGAKIWVYIVGAALILAAIAFLF